MLVVLPLGTDAPIYHFPWATIGLIVLCSAVFLVVGPADRIDFEPVEMETTLSAEDDGENHDPAAALAAMAAKAKARADAKAESEAEDVDEDVEREFEVARELEPFVLVHGHGLHPLQWVTSNFIHANIGHLVGNMLFLWVFAILVEGKVGWWRFLLVFLGIGVVQCAAEQLVMLWSSSSVSYGASAIVYGLMAMSLVWAPRNDLNCFVFIWYGFRFYIADHEIPILWFATWYIVVEAITAALSGFSLSSSMLHFSGSVVGFLLGTILLKARWVDCENWDLYAVMNGTHGQAGKKAAKAKRKRKRAPASQVDAGAAPAPAEAVEQASPSQRKGAAAAESMRQAVAEGHSAAALAIFQKTDRLLSGWEPPEADLLALIKLLHQDQRWVDSVPLMEQYARRFPDRSARIRLKLAQVLLRDQQRPVQALRVLGEIPAGALPDPLEQVRQQLGRKAVQMRDEGVLELEGESW